VPQSLDKRLAGSLTAGRPPGSSEEGVVCVPNRKGGSRTHHLATFIGGLVMMKLHQVRHGRQDNHATNHVRCAETSRAKQSRRHIETTRWCVQARCEVTFTSSMTGMPGEVSHCTTPARKWGKSDPGHCCTWPWHALPKSIRHREQTGTSIR
jgi:hypothetical protein